MIKIANLMELNFSLVGRKSRRVKSSKAEEGESDDETGSQALV